jgi:hypothetical protein
LIASKRLKRDTPLVTAAKLPKFDPSATVAQLLLGSAGLRNLELVERLRLAAITTRRMLADRFDALAVLQHESVVPPGSTKGSLPSRIQTLYLQRVCESVTGEDFSEWVTRELFGELGMSDSWVIPRDDEGDPIFTRIEWKDRSWVGKDALGPRAWHAPMVSLRDLTTWLEFLRSEAPLARMWREEFEADYPDFAFSNAGSVRLSLRTTDVPERRAYVEIDLGLLEGGPDRGMLDAALNGTPLQLKHPGREMGLGGRGRRGIPAIDKTPVRAGVSGSYFAPEVDLEIQLVRADDGQLLLVHPRREKPLSFYQSDEANLAVSRWVLIRSIRFFENEQGRVIGFRASGNGLNQILFERLKGERR